MFLIVSPFPILEDIMNPGFDHGDGSLYLRMVGSCSGCAQSHATLQEGVKKLLLGLVAEWWDAVLMSPLRLRLVGLPEGSLISSVPTRPKDKCIFFEGTYMLSC